MSIQQCASAAVRVFPDTAIETRSGRHSLRAVMVAIAQPQSGWNPRAAGDCGLPGPSCGPCTLGGSGATSWGLWQIHSSTSAFLVAQTHSTNACDWAAWLFNPVNNAKAAYDLYQRQGLAGAWGGASGQWDTDAVEAAIPQAEAAVAAVTSAPGVGGSTVGSTQKTPTRSVLSTITPSPPVALAAVLVAGGLSIAAWETDANWGSIREWFGRPRRRGTIIPKGD